MLPNDARAVAEQPVVRWVLVDGRLEGTNSDEKVRTGRYDLEKVVGIPLLHPKRKPFPKLAKVRTGYSVTEVSEPARG